MAGAVTSFLQTNIQAQFIHVVPDFTRIPHPVDGQLHAQNVKRELYDLNAVARRVSCIAARRGEHSGQRRVRRADRRGRVRGPIMRCFRCARAEGPHRPRLATPHDDTARRREKQTCSGNTIGPADDHARTIHLVVAGVKIGCFGFVQPDDCKAVSRIGADAGVAPSALLHRCDLP